MWLWWRPSWREVCGSCPTLEGAWAKAFTLPPRTPSLPHMVSKPILSNLPLKSDIALMLMPKKMLFYLFIFYSYLLVLLHLSQISCVAAIPLMWKCLLSAVSTSRGFGLMFLNEVALGKEYTITSDNGSLKKAPNGFDSVVARGQREPGGTTHQLTLHSCLVIYFLKGMWCECTVSQCW